MTDAKQEVITPEQMRFIREHERSMEKWAQNQKAEKSGAAFFTTLALPLWVISFLASGATGFVNQPMWFTAFAVVTFVAAVVSTITAVVFWITRIMAVKPVKSATLQKVQYEERDW